MKKRKSIQDNLYYFARNWKTIAIKKVVPAVAGCVMWAGCVIFYIVQMGNLP